MDRIPHALIIAEDIDLLLLLKTVQNRKTVICLVTEKD